MPLDRILVERSKRLLERSVDGLGLPAAALMPKGRIWPEWGLLKCSKTRQVISDIIISYHKIPIWHITDNFIGMFDMHAAGGIAVRTYTPDRDVFEDRRVLSVEGLWLVSPAQALLDCAGLGYAGRDLTQKLVEAYGRL